MKNFSFRPFTDSHPLDVTAACKSFRQRRNFLFSSQRTMGTSMKRKCSPLLRSLNWRLCYNRIAILLPIKLLFWLSLHLKGDVPEEVCHASVARQEWKLGQANKDNGVLLLISIKDRQIRIEVGHGLEGVLTDAHPVALTGMKLLTFFRTGDYDNGVKAGVKKRSLKRLKANTRMKTRRHEQRRRREACPSGRC